MLSSACVLITLTINANRTAEESSTDHVLNVAMPEDLTSKFVAKDAEYLAGSTKDLTALQGRERLPGEVIMREKYTCSTILPRYGLSNLS